MATMKRAIEALEQRTADQGAVRKMFAEDFSELVEEHRKVCKDPKCDETTLINRFPGVRVAPMIQVGAPNELFLTVNSKPFWSIQLADGELATFFNKNGKIDSANCQHAEELTEAFLWSTCGHNDGVGIRVLPDNQVVLACVNNECGLSVISVKVASYPKVDPPFIFCTVHGKQHGYLVCKHVMEGKEPMIVDRASDTDTGTALCGDNCERILRTFSLKQFEKHKRKFGIVCAGHLNELVGGKLEQLLKQVEAA